MAFNSVIRSLRTESILFCLTLSFVLLLNSTLLVSWLESTFDAQYPGEFRSIISAVRCLATLAFFALVFPDTHSLPLLAFSTAATLTTIGVFQPEGVGILGSLIEVAPLVIGAATAFVLILRDEDLDEHDGSLSWKAAFQTPRQQQPSLGVDVGVSKQKSALSQSAASLVYGARAGSSSSSEQVSSKKKGRSNVTASGVAKEVEPASVEKASVEASTRKRTEEAKKRKASPKIDQVKAKQSELMRQRAEERIKQLRNRSSRK